MKNMGASKSAATASGMAGRDHAKAAGMAAMPGMGAGAPGGMAARTWRR